MSRRNVIAMVFVVLVAMGANGSHVSGQQATPAAGETDIAAAVTWLLEQQAESGAFLGFTGEPDAGTTADAVLALVAAGHADSDAVASAMAWLDEGDTAAVFAATGPGQAAKLVLALVATGESPTQLGSIDPLEQATAQYDDETGLYSASVFEHAMILKALAGSGEMVPDAAIEALADVQTPEGGWAFDGSTGEGMADSNTTAMVVMALAAVNAADGDMAQAAIEYLRSAIADETGAMYQPGADLPADSSSTALVLQAVTAIGENAASDAWGNLPAALATFQTPNGAFHFNDDDTSDNVFSTVQAIPAAAGVVFPIVITSDAAGYVILPEAA